MQKYKLSVTFSTSLLGTQPQKETALEYITSKAIDPATGQLPEDETGTLPEELQRGTTAFHKLDGSPILYDYQVKGFIKEAGQVFNGLRGVKNLRSKLDNLLFVEPRQIPLQVPAGAEMTFCDRPLRAMTAQGPRVSLARSEELPQGTAFECELAVYESALSEPLIRDLLDYGARKGIGQWRNGGHGRFSYSLQKID